MNVNQKKYFFSKSCFGAFFIFLLIVSCEFPGNPFPGMKDAAWDTVISKSDSVKFLEGIPETVIVIDGDVSDWSGIDPLAAGTGNIHEISGYAGVAELYLLAEGHMLDAPAAWYINSDMDSTTGYLPMDGAEYYIQDDMIFHYMGTGTLWDWTYEQNTVSIVKNSLAAEVSLPWSFLGLPGKSAVRLCFERNYSEYLPGYGELVILADSLPEPSAPPELFYPVFESIPNGFGIAIDDVGWIYWKPENSRDERLEDYRTISRVAENLNIRIMTAIILQNFDLANIAAKTVYNQPSAPSNMTEDGLFWDNSDMDSAYPLSVMEHYRHSSASIELGVHGVAHEHYGGNADARAEFAHIYEWPDIGRSEPWGVQDNRNKFQCFEDILRLYFSSAECSFPRSMVPPGHAWFFGTDGLGDSQSTGSVASPFGVKYMNADLDVSFQGGPSGLVDNGVLVMHRASGCNYDWEAQVPWYGDYNEFEYPAYPTNYYSWIEAHFPNFWGGEEIWSNYLSGLNNHNDKFLAKNSAQTASQWLYFHDASITGSHGSYSIDISNMRLEAYEYNLLGSLVLKTPLNGKHISSASLKPTGSILGYWEDSYGYGYLVLGDGTNLMGRLSAGNYTLTAELGPDFMESFVDLTSSTFNVYGYSSSKKDVLLTIELYGRQEVRVRLPFEPVSVSSGSPGISIDAWNYNGDYLFIDAVGRDIQGEIGDIFITG